MSTGICVIVNGGTEYHNAIAYHDIPDYTMQLIGNRTKVGRGCCLRVLGCQEGGGIPGCICCRR